MQINIHIFSFLGSTAQLSLHKIRPNFLEASQQFSFLQGRVVSPTPNPLRRTRPLYLHPPEAGWLTILVASYDTHGLRWGTYSYIIICILIHSRCYVLNFMLLAYRLNFAEVVRTTKKVRQACGLDIFAADLHVARRRQNGQPV
jgi:hypothetical protein